MSQSLNELLSRLSISSIVRCPKKVIIGKNSVTSPITCAPVYRASEVHEDNERDALCAHSTEKVESSSRKWCSPVVEVVVEERNGWRLVVTDFHCDK